MLNPVRYRRHPVRGASPIGFRQQQKRLSPRVLCLLCVCGRLWLASMEKKLFRNDFSVGKHHFLPSTSTFFIPTPALAVGDLYHLLLDGLTRFRVSRCSFGGHCYEATARSTSFMKPLVWTYRTRSGDSKPSSAFTDCNLTKSIASLCNL